MGILHSLCLLSVSEIQHGGREDDGEEQSTGQELFNSELWGYFIFAGIISFIFCEINQMTIRLSQDSR